MNINKELIGKWYHDMWNNWKDVIPQIMEEDISFRGSPGNEKNG